MDYEIEMQWDKFVFQVRYVGDDKYCKYRQFSKWPQNRSKKKWKIGGMSYACTTSLLAVWMVDGCEQLI